MTDVDVAYQEAMEAIDRWYWCLAESLALKYRERTPSPQTIYTWIVGELFSTSIDIQTIDHLKRLLRVASRGTTESLLNLERDVLKALEILEASPPTP